MKKFLFLIMVSFVVSCTNEDCALNVNTTLEMKVENEYAKSKLSTVAHNEMLETTLDFLRCHPIKSDRNIIQDGKKIDECVSLFFDANQNSFTKVKTRAKEENQITKNELRTILLGNQYLFNNQTCNTRGVQEVEYPEYLVLFYNDFFKSDSLKVETLDLDIKLSIKKVLESYPDLTENEIKALAFVAGITYNSCQYWNENAEKWIEIVAGEPYLKTRSNWLWSGVKNGVKKWAKADSSGAISGVVASRTWMGALAGAAVGSMIGAWENLPMWG